MARSQHAVYLYSLHGRQYFHDLGACFDHKRIGLSFSTFSYKRSNNFLNFFRRRKKKHSAIELKEKMQVHVITFN